MNCTTLNRPYWIHRNPQGTYTVKVIMGSKNVVLYEAGAPIIRTEDDPDSEDWFTKEDFTSREAAEAFIAGMELAECNPIYTFVKVGARLEFVQDRRSPQSQIDDTRYSSCPCSRSTSCTLPEKREVQPVTREMQGGYKRRTQLPYGYELAGTYFYSYPPGHILMETYRNRSRGRREYYKYYYVNRNDERCALSGYVLRKVSWIEMENRARRVAKYDAWKPKSGTLL